MENHWRYCQPPPMSGRSPLLCPVYDWIRLFSFRLHLASAEWRQNPIRFRENLMLEFCIASEGLTPEAKPATRTRPPFDGFPSPYSLRHRPHPTRTKLPDQRAPTHSALI